MSDAPEFTLRWRGRQSGPYPVTEINRMLDDHKIGMGHEIFYQEEWITLEAFFAALQKAAAPTANAAIASLPLAPAREKAPPLRVKVAPAPAAEDAVPGTVARLGRPRRRLVFALLAVFTGFSGVHNFYARQWMTGLLQLLLSVATTLMGFGIIASWLWAVVEALAVRRDGRGDDMI